MTSDETNTPDKGDEEPIDAALAALFAELDALGPGNGKSREEIEAEMYGEFGEPI